VPSRRVHDLCRHIVSGIHCQAGATPHQERVWPSQALALSPSQRDRPALQPSAGSLPPEALAHPSQKFGRGVAPAQLRCRGYASWKVCANSADVHSQRRGASGDQSSHDARARRASHRKQAALHAHSRGRIRVVARHTEVATLGRILSVLRSQCPQTRFAFRMACSSNSHATCLLAR
jgi:hypothetical protein